VPGSEGYDRILLVTGAFPAARRVETEVVFRSFCADQIWAGFGVLPLWGGHLDEPGRRPRRGWLYGVAWFMKPYGPWCEFSVKRGDQARHDTFAGRTTIEPQPGTRFRIIAECWPETSPLGGHVRYRQRAKIWPMDQPEPRDWIECAEQGGARLPERDYAVALLAHQCQVEFGPVRVLPLPGGSR